MRKKVLILQSFPVAEHTFFIDDRKGKNRYLKSPATEAVLTSDDRDALPCKKIFYCQAEKKL